MIGATVAVPYGRGGAYHVEETMRCYPEHDEFTPLSVVGLPRAGTRFVADALNLSDEVCLQGEVLDSTVQGLRVMFDGAEHYFSSRGKLDLWRRRKQHLTVAAWANASKSVPRPLPEHCRFYGFKAPQHERYFDFYEDVFAANPPLWVFCLRNFRDQFRSLMSMKWRTGNKATIEFIGAEYVKALDALDAMTAAAPERVFTFVLDDHIADQPGYLSALLEQVGVAADAELLDRMTGLGRRNSAESKGLAVHEPTDAEEEWIAARPDIARRFDALSTSARSRSGS